MIPLSIRFEDDYELWQSLSMNDSNINLTDISLRNEKRYKIINSTNNKRENGILYNSTPIKKSLRG